MVHSTKQLGNNGEAAVATFLQNRGFTILACNYQTKLGEVDIIASKKEIVAFVEVKTRRHAYFPISQVITIRKQQRIIKAAKQYIQVHKLANKAFRFDVATVIFDDASYNIEYIENAYNPLC